MVYHTHARHHFKIHDAVNFDDIPEDMLLDPYTPPPRPTYYYPVIYDDVIEGKISINHKVYNLYRLLLNENQFDWLSILGIGLKSDLSLLFTDM